MHSSSASAVRLLAAWQQRRRQLGDRLDGLLLHGPTAVSRVAARADELRAALEAERDAFEAFVALVESPDRAGAARPSESAEPADPPGDYVLEERRAYPRLRAVPSDVL